MMHRISFIADLLSIEILLIVSIFSLWLRSQRKKYSCLLMIPVILLTILFHAFKLIWCKGRSEFFFLRRTLIAIKILCFRRSKLFSFKFLKCWWFRFILLERKSLSINTHIDSTNWSDFRSWEYNLIIWGVKALVKSR